MSRFTPVRHTALCLVLTLGGAAPLAALGGDGSCGPRDTPNQIFPGDPRWKADLNVYPNQTNFGTVGISATNPRSGNGSLELTTSGSLFDWAFFQRLAEGGAWGLLSAVNCVTFDWYRNGYTLPPGAPASLTAETWQEQTPVLRLLVRDVVGNETLNTQLVWERWYNTRGELSPTANDQWNFENLSNQLFWRHLDGGNLYTNAGCANTSFVTSADLETFDLNGWVTNCYSPNAEVYGIMIGLGSYWPGDYQAWLDNVQLGFSDRAGLTVEDNFEMPLATVVPEPGSLILLGTGLAGLAGAAFLRRRKRSS